MLRLCVWISVCAVVAAAPRAGLIRSPGFPHGYGPDESERWRPCAPPGQMVVLTVLQLDLEESDQCENDNLKISADHNVLANLCGKKSQEELQSLNPSLRSSSGGCLNVTFRSDYSNVQRHTGFFLFYTMADVDECSEADAVCSHFCHNFIGGYSCSCKPGYYLDQDQHECHANCTEQRSGAGVVTSPGSPGPYYENAQCSFLLSVDEGFQLELKFTGVFDVESRDGQCIDFVSIRTDHTTFGPFCGKDKPDAILTASQHADVTFESDLDGTHRGFTLEYKPTVMRCPAVETSDATAFPLKTRYAVSETVHVHCHDGYALINGFKSYKSTCLSDGRWDQVLICKPVDCGVPDFPFMMHRLVDMSETTYKNNMTVICFSEYYQLEGAANFTCNAAGDWVAENGELFSEDSPQCTPVCGITQEIFGGRIFGGKKAELGQIPWQLLVKFPERGGASLINDYWAVTAAHVVEKHQSLIFTGGMIDAQQENVQMQTEKIIIHPNYVTGQFDSDIALLKMSSRVPLGRYLLPVCLPKTKSTGTALENMIGTVSGFGGRSKEITRARYLQYAQVKEYHGVCFDSPLKVTENMFCAGDEDKRVDSCQGDSGGPLFVPALGFGSTERPYQLKGIVSWGPSVCGNTHYKGYYTKVDNYLTWIKDTIKNN